MKNKDTVFHPDEHRTDTFEVEDREEESMDDLEEDDETEQTTLIKVEKPQ